MDYRTAIHPFPVGSALAARQGQVDFNSETSELSGLVCHPVRAIRCLYDMENTPSAFVLRGQMITCRGPVHTLDVVISK